MKSFTLAAVSALCISSGATYAATLSDLVAVATLTEGDVTFSGFEFRNEVPDPPFPDDFNADASEIEVTTSSTSTTTTLSFALDPSPSILGELTVFDFLIDFDVAITGGSSRTLTDVTLGGGDLFASEDAFSDVNFADAVDEPSVLVNIFEDTLNGSHTSMTDDLDGVTSLNLLGRANGQTFTSTATAGLSTFSLTFDLAGTAPPPSPVPLPAGLPLLLAGLGGLALLRRRKTL